MAKSKVDGGSVDQETDSILKGLAGTDDYMLWQKYYCFTVIFHYIGTVVKLNTETIVLGDDAMIVLAAGDANDAVSQIVQGKCGPKVYERPGRPIYINRAGITAMIPF